MPTLKGTKTHENLKYAFAGESQANRRYLYFAKVADVEGYPEIAGNFRDTAEGETGHAHGHLDYLKQVGDPATGLPIGNTAKNLKSAVADADGVVCLPSVAGEPNAAERLQRTLATAFGAAWSPSKLIELLERAGSKKKNLGEWLRDEFFKQHCALFMNRPFIWNIWDGHRDGFSALVNYLRLDRTMLEKLTYTYLGQDWIERQRAAVRDNTAGAEGRPARGS